MTPVQVVASIIGGVVVLALVGVLVFIVSRWIGEGVRARRVRSRRRRGPVKRQPLPKLYQPPVRSRVVRRQRSTPTPRSIDDFLDGESA